MEFRDVQDWAIAPSSSTELNQVMLELKERVRLMMYGRKSAAIFLRHENASKSSSDNPNARRDDNNYCQKHFQTIIINPLYRRKLKDRVVCVMDDYLTNGNTFETLRNLLVACKVKKIIFVAIGKFIHRDENCYSKKIFSIEGDVYQPGYTATYQSKELLFFNVNNEVKRDVAQLTTLASKLDVIRNPFFVVTNTE